MLYNLDLMKREIEPLGREENMDKSRWLKLEQKAKDKEINKNWGWLV